MVSKWTGGYITFVVNELFEKGFLDIDKAYDMVNRKMLGRVREKNG